MPKFNMSADDATKLVNYFAAIDNVDYPYQFNPLTRSSHLTKMEAAFTGEAGDTGNARLAAAMDVVTNGNYCIKCHQVGDFHPKGSPRAHGPDLAEIYRRMRPGYLRDWIADPKRVLPYTAMPVNIVYDESKQPFWGGVSQDLYHGTSVQQVEGLVDLLMNFDEYSRGRSLIAPLVDASAKAAKEAADKKAAEAAAAAKAAASVADPDVSRADATTPPTNN
jgi:hypothetical protein